MFYISVFVELAAFLFSVFLSISRFYSFACVWSKIVLEGLNVCLFVWFWRLKPLFKMHTLHEHFEEVDLRFG